MSDREFSGGSGGGYSGSGGGYKSGGGRGGPKRKGGGGRRRTSFRKRRPSANLTFDYKNVHGMTPFLTEEGKIVPARVSGLSASQQRELTLAVKRARNIGFLSAINRYTIQ